jgi:hypothetical protein
MKSYSRLTVREKIEVNLKKIEVDLEFYNEDPLSHQEQIEKAENSKKRLQEDAHYDAEKNLGYQHPTTRRWRKK